MVTQPNKKMESKQAGVSMRIYETYSDLPEEALGSVVVIGNFDGVHRGHVSLLEKAKEIAEGMNTIVSVLTFEPHPRSLFRPDDPPFRITPADIKAQRFESSDVAQLFSISFDWDFASQSAQSFIRNILLEGIKPAHIVVGYDFRFGQLRKGDAETIKAAGIPVTVVDEVADEDEGPLSSSRIRQALRHGEIARANELLGWQWEMRGEVIKGDRRGRELGFPTANFQVGNTVHPAYGVYAARVQVQGEGEWLPAATNIGIRPMFKIPTAQVESFIFDFDREIYNKTLRVRPVQFLRGEARFESLDELTNQMQKDCTQAREILT